MSVYRLRQEQVAVSDLGDEVVLMDLASSAYLGFRDTGAVLLRLLIAGATAPELEQALLAEYDVDAATAAEDVRDFVRDLTDRSLLVTDG